MNRWFGILLTFALVLTPSFAGAEERDDDADQSGEVYINRNLAVHLGLTSDEVGFGAPRNFRAEQLNQAVADVDVKPAIADRLPEE